MIEDKPRTSTLNISSFEPATMSASTIHELFPPYLLGFLHASKANDTDTNTKEIGPNRSIPKKSNVEEHATKSTNRPPKGLPGSSPKSARRAISSE